MHCFSKQRDEAEISVWEWDSTCKDVHKPIHIQVECGRPDVKISEKDGVNPSSQTSRKMSGRELKHSVMRVFANTNELIHKKDAFRLIRKKEGETNEAVEYQWNEAASAQLSDKKHFRIRIVEEDRQYVAFLQVPS